MILGFVKMHCVTRGHYYSRCTELNRRHFGKVDNNDIKLAYINLCQLIRFLKIVGWIFAIVIRPI